MCKHRPADVAHQLRMDTLQFCLHQEEEDWFQMPGINTDLSKGRITQGRLYKKHCDLLFQKGQSLFRSQSACRASKVTTLHICLLTAWQLINDTWKKRKRWLTKVFSVTKYEVAHMKNSKKARFKHTHTHTEHAPATMWIHFIHFPKWIWLQLTTSSGLWKTRQSLL